MNCPHHRVLELFETTRSARGAAAYEGEVRDGGGPVRKWVACSPANEIRPQLFMAEMPFGRPSTP